MIYHGLEIICANNSTYKLYYLSQIYLYQSYKEVR